MWLGLPELEGLPGLGGGGGLGVLTCLGVPGLEVLHKMGCDYITCHNKLRDTLAEACGRNVKVEAGSSLIHDTPTLI